MWVSIAARAMHALSAHPLNASRASLPHPFLRRVTIPAPVASAAELSPVAVPSLEKAASGGVTTKQGTTVRMVGAGGMVNLLPSFNLMESF